MTAFVHTLAFTHYSLRCLQWNRFIESNAKSLSNSGMQERLVCARIRSIRGTRLLPPDIEREFVCTGRPSASELILTCHSVMAYARSSSVSSLLLPVRSFKDLLTSLPLSKSSSCRDSPNPLLQSIRKAAYSVDYMQIQST